MLHVPVLLEESLDFLLHDLSGAYLDLTFGRGRPISKLIQILNTQFPKLKIHYKTRDKFMPIRGTLSTKKAKKILGFKSNFPLEIGYLK